METQEEDHGRVVRFSERIDELMNGDPIDDGDDEDGDHADEFPSTQPTQAITDDFRGLPSALDDFKVGLRLKNGI